MQGNSENSHDPILQAIEKQIDSLQKQLAHLQDARRSYLAAFQPGASSEVSSRGFENQQTGITTEHILDAFEAIPVNLEFTPEDVFSHITKLYDVTVRKKRSASALICTVLAKQVEKGLVEKIGRGRYRKPDGITNNGSLKESDI